MAATMGLGSGACLTPSQHIYRANYRVDLTHVQAPTKAAALGAAGEGVSDPASRTTQIEPLFRRSDGRWWYDTDEFTVGVSAESDHIVLEIENRSPANLSLPWEQSSFVDIQGVGQGVVTNIQDRPLLDPAIGVLGNREPEKTVLAPKARQRVRVYPRANVYLDNGLQTWSAKPLIEPMVLNSTTAPTLNGPPEKWHQAVKQNVGKQIGLILATELGGQTETLTFWFDILDVQFTTQKR